MSDLDTTNPLSADDTAKTCVYMVLRQLSLVHSTRIGRFLGNCSDCWSVAEVDDRCSTANFATFEENQAQNFCSWGQPVHEEKRCRGWADGASKSSSWRAAAAGRMSTLIVIAAPFTTHATRRPHFHFCMCSKPSTCRKRSSICISFAKHLLIQDHPRFLKSLKRF